MAPYNRIQEPVEACTGNGRSDHRNRLGATDAAKNVGMVEEYVEEDRIRTVVGLDTFSMECTPTGQPASVEAESTVQTMVAAGTA